MAERKPTSAACVADRFASRCCDYIGCRIPAFYWKDIRRIETADGLLFCSQTCLDRYEDVTRRRQTIVYQVPFVWDREADFTLLPIGSTR